MDTLLHFILPKLECFSEKQLNQNYLQTRPGPYLSLYRGNPPLLNFWSIIGFTKLTLVSLQICTMHKVEGGSD